MVRDWGQDTEDFDVEQTTGFADIVPGGGVKVTTGAHTGAIPLTILLLTHPPESGWDEWDEVVELGYVAPEGKAQVLSWPDAPLPGRLVISHTGPGGYRLRFHARNRDDPRNQDPFTVVEEHMIAVWPGDVSPPVVVHKATDECGKRWRKEIS